MIIEILFIIYLLITVGFVIPFNIGKTKSLVEDQSKEIHELKLSLMEVNKKLEKMYAKQKINEMDEDKH